MGRYALTAVGADRPGIVAAVSGALAEHRGNIEDSTMTILGGQFAILLVVSVPDPSSAAPGGPSGEPIAAHALERALEPVADQYDLVVTVRALGGEETITARVQAPVESWAVSVHGADHPGIVHAIAAALAAGGGNIVDLVTHLTGDPAGPVYVMTLRVAVPAGESASLAERVQQAAADVGVHCTIHPDEADLL